MPTLNACDSIRMSSRCGRSAPPMVLNGTLQCPHVDLPVSVSFRRVVASCAQRNLVVRPRRDRRPRRASGYGLRTDGPVPPRAACVPSEPTKAKAKGGDALGRLPSAADGPRARRAVRSVSASCGVQVALMALGILGLRDQGNARPPHSGTHVVGLHALAVRFRCAAHELSCPLYHCGAW